MEDTFSACFLLELVTEEYFLPLGYCGIKCLNLPQQIYYNNKSKKNDEHLL